MTENQFPYLFSKASRYRSDNGFAVILLLTFLPVALSIALLVPIGIHVFGIHKSQLHACRQGLLDAQAIALKTIAQMKLLNMESQFLRVQKKTAQAMMLVPKTAVAGLRLYSQTRRAQKALDIRQRATLNLGKLQLQKQLWQTTLSVKKTSSSLFVATTRSLPNLQPIIAIRPDDDSDIAPVYVLEDDFMHKQAQQVSWMTHLELRGDFTWKNELGWQTIKRTQACAASIEEKNGHFQVVLTVAKSWPNFSSHF